jgi:glycosyltransferase involved in cell wall biosynthesis
MTAKVAHLTSVHTPLDIRIFHKECKSLAGVGYEVVLIASGEKDETYDGVRIRTVPLEKTRWRRMIHTTWQIYQSALAENALIYHFHDPELIPIGLLLKLHNKRVIYDVHEDLPRQILGKYWIPKRLRSSIAKLSDVFEIMSASLLDSIISATPAIARRFPAKKTIVVQNFPTLQELAPTKSCSHDTRSQTGIYIGGIDSLRGVREIVASISFLPKEFKLVLAGVFDPPEFIDELKQLPGWERVKFLGWLTRQQIAQQLSLARVGLVLLHPRPNFLESYPIKLFEYMAAGLPVIASDFPLWRDIVNEAKCGRLVNPLDPKAISTAIQWILDHPDEAETMGKRGQEAVRTQYNWDSESHKLRFLYSNLSRISQ